MRKHSIGNLKNNIRQNIAHVSVYVCWALVLPGKWYKVKYFDDPVINSRFTQFIDLFADLIEKYGGDMIFPEITDQSWENSHKTVQEAKKSNDLTNTEAA